MLKNTDVVTLSSACEESCCDHCDVKNCPLSPNDYQWTNTGWCCSYSMQLVMKALCARRQLAPII